MEGKIEIRYAKNLISGALYHLKAVEGAIIGKGLYDVKLNSEVNYLEGYLQGILVTLDIM